jgi:hypothetical protein
MQETMEGVKKMLVAAQHRQKLYTDKKRSPHTFAVGQSIVLSTKHMRFRGKVRKIQSKFIGPFEWNVTSYVMIISTGYFRCKCAYR